VVVAVLALGSCEFPGFLGESFDLNETLYTVAEDTLEQYDGKAGTLFLSTNTGSDQVVVFTGSVTTDGAASAHLEKPAASLILPWADIMPIPPVLTEDDAGGCVINTMSLFADGSEYPLSFRNLADDKYVYLGYADVDVRITVSGGPIEGPGGVQANMSMDIELKKGWNLIILTRTGTMEPFTDTYTVGDMPENVHLILEGRAR
jgi:hypothetical protein